MTNIKLLITLLAGVLAGFLLSFLLNDESYPAYKPQSSAKVIQLNSGNKERILLKRIDSLNNHQLKLTSELNNTKTELSKSKRKNLFLQRQVYNLIDKEYTADTVERLANCDTLQQIVVELIENSNFKDSLYEASISNYEDQLKNKDSTIQEQINLYSATKNFLHQSLHEQQLLEVQNKQLQKQVKRQKIKGKIVTAGLLILSGVVVSQLIQ